MARQHLVKVEDYGCSLSGNRFMLLWGAPVHRNVSPSFPTRKDSKPKLSCMNIVRFMNEVDAEMAGNRGVISKLWPPIFLRMLSMTRSTRERVCDLDYRIAAQRISE